LLLTGGSAFALPVQSQTIVFRGQLLRRGDGPTVSRVTVRLKQFGATVTNDDGYFEIAIPADTRTVEVQQVELSNRQWVVLYPPGAIRVPRDGTVVDIILGLSYEAQIAQVFGRWSEELRTSLGAAGRKQDEIQRTLDSIRVLFASRAQVDAESLRVSEQRVNERARQYPSIASALEGFVNEAKDVHNAFKLIVEFAFTSTAAFGELSTAIREYSAAYERLNAEGRGYSQNISKYWQSETLAGEYRAVLDLALGDIHAIQIYPLNTTLTDINRILQRQVTGRAAEDLKREVVARVAAVVRNLDPRITELQRRVGDLLTRLATA
jgi:hypothetical protein